MGPTIISSDTLKWQASLSLSALDYTGFSRESDDHDQVPASLRHYILMCHANDIIEDEEHLVL